MTDANTIVLGARFEEALVYAARLHARQLRKNTAIPYISHLLSVTALVIQDGGSEDEAIAALLHDAPEDQGGEEVLEEIRTRFGEQVVSIVEICSDTFEDPKPPWRDRKQKYLDHLRIASLDVLRVSLADKIHNANGLLLALKLNGEETWQRFNGGKEGTIWYYRSLAKVFQERRASISDPGFTFFIDEFCRIVAAIEESV